MSSNPCYPTTVLKGNGALGLRINANRRRTKAEIREEKLQEEARAADIEKKLLELEQLKAAYQNNQGAVDNAGKIMQNLYDQGLLKSTGEPG